MNHADRAAAKIRRSPSPSSATGDERGSTGGRSARVCRVFSSWSTSRSGGACRWGSVSSSSARLAGCGSTSRSTGGSGGRSSASHGGVTRPSPVGPSMRRVDSLRAASASSSVGGTSGQLAREPGGAFSCSGRVAGTGTLRSVALKPPWRDSVEVFGRGGMAVGRFRSARALLIAAVVRVGRNGSPASAGGILLRLVWVGALPADGGAETGRPAGVSPCRAGASPTSVSRSGGVETGRVTAAAGMTGDDALDGEVTGVGATGGAPNGLGAVVRPPEAGSGRPRRLPDGSRRGAR